MTADRRGKGRGPWVLLVLALSFVLPFVLGQMAYERGWFSGGATNKGELISPPLAARELALTGADGAQADLAGHWWLVYVVPEVCDAACQQSWQALPSMRAGLGRERDRVGILLIRGARSAPIPETLALLPEVREVSGDVGRLAERMVSAGVPAPAVGRWFIMDPMGWVMLSYLPPPASDAAILRAQDVLDDLQKLLKVSRIG
ncbi:MAG: hypothetical protein VW625_01760 [Perlucidibaca sp.]